MIRIKGFEVFWAPEWSMWAVRKEGTYSEASTSYFTHQADAIAACDLVDVPAGDDENGVLF